MPKTTKQTGLDRLRIDFKKDNNVFTNMTQSQIAKKYGYRGTSAISTIKRALGFKCKRQHSLNYMAVQRLKAIGRFDTSLMTQKEIGKIIKSNSRQATSQFIKKHNIEYKKQGNK